jgi:hypothetical protein
MKTVTAAMALALIGFVPAVGAECGHDAAAAAAAAAATYEKFADKLIEIIEGVED